MPTPAELAQRFVDAMVAGASREHLVTPDFRFVGEPFQGMLMSLEGEDSPDTAAAAIEAGDVALRFAPVEPAGPGKAWVEVVWTHGQAHGRGSAGLQWVVFTVEGGLVRELRFFQDAERARAFAFAGR